jgi:hypothetical protein
VPNVPESDPQRGFAETTQLGSRSAVPILPVAGQHVTEINTVPDVPLSYPFVEPLIGTVRREFLDRTLFWTSADLEAKLLEFQHYYNGHRTHAGLEGQLPAPDSPRAPVDFAAHRWQKHCQGDLPRFSQPAITEDFR